MVHFEKIENSVKGKMIIEIEDFKPEETLEDLKNSIIETLCDSVNSGQCTPYIYPLLRFLQQLNVVNEGKREIEKRSEFVNVGNDVNNDYLKKIVSLGEENGILREKLKMLSEKQDVN